MSAQTLRGLAGSLQSYWVVAGILRPTHFRDQLQSKLRLRNCPLVAVRGVSLSADEQLIATTGDDGTICIWPSMKAESEPSGDADAKVESESKDDSEPDDNVAIRIIPTSDRDSRAG